MKIPWIKPDNPKFYKIRRNTIYNNYIVYSKKHCVFGELEYFQQFQKSPRRFEFENGEEKHYISINLKDVDAYISARLFYKLIKQTIKEK